MKIPVEEVKRKYRNKLEDFDGDGSLVFQSAKLAANGDQAEGPGSLENYVLKRYDYGRKTKSWKAYQVHHLLI